MDASITAKTEIQVFVNGNKTFSVKNSPEMGPGWVTKSGMNRVDYFQGLLAIAEVAHNLMIHKIKMDSERVNKSKNAVDNG